VVHRVGLNACREHYAARARRQRANGGAAPVALTCAVNDMFAATGAMPTAADMGDCLFKASVQQAITLAYGKPYGNFRGISMSPFYHPSADLRSF
jgi:hypothetical protein